MEEWAEDVALEEELEALSDAAWAEVVAESSKQAELRALQKDSAEEVESLEMAEPEE